MDATFLKKEQQCWERQRNKRQDKKPSGDHKTTRPGLSKAHQWPHPLLPPLESPGAGRGHMMFLWILSSKIQRHGLQVMWSPGLTVPRHMDRYNVDMDTHTHMDTHYSLRCQLGQAQRSLGMQQGEGSRKTQRLCTVGSDASRLPSPTSP